jgi:1,4-dihydroxy-2-naphthoyl-CoA hydrolase
MSAAALAERPDLRRVPAREWPALLTEHHRSGLTGLLDCEIVRLEPSRAEGRLELRDALMLRTGHPLHGGTVVALADSCAGWGCLATLPEGRTGFATSGLTASLVGSASVPDALVCLATLLHGGRTTQVWDALVTRESDGRAVAHFRATQHLLG